MAREVDTAVWGSQGGPGFFPALSSSTGCISMCLLQIPFLYHHFVLSGVKFPNVFSSSCLGLRDIWFHLLPTCCDIIYDQLTLSPGKVEREKLEFRINVLKQTKARYFVLPKKMDAQLREREGSCLVYRGSFHLQHCRKTEHETRLN